MDLSTQEGKLREERNTALLLVRRALDRAQREMEFLINATPTGERRNLLTDINIRVLEANTFAHALTFEQEK